MFHTYHQGRLVPVAGMILVDGMVINGAAWGEGDSVPPAWHQDSDHKGLGFPALTSL